MTLKQLKEQAVQLIDEYSNNANITDDEDIQLKLNNLFQMGQIELALICKIDKVYIPIIPEIINEPYAVFELPDDFMELSRIRSINGDSLKALDYYFQKDGQKNYLKIKSNSLKPIEIEYYAYPTTITSETTDDFEFELDIEAQMVLPYYVASDILKSDVSANYTSFEAKYNAKLEVLYSNIKNVGSITIEPIEGCFL